MRLNHKSSILALPLILLFSFLQSPLMTSAGESIAPAKGNLNLDVDISAVNATVESGNDAIFELNIKATGNAEYKDAQIVLDLPEGYELKEDYEDLEIGGVVPVEGKDKNHLVYNLKQVIPGMAQRLYFTFKTENGTPNDTKLKMTSEFTADGFSTFDDSTKTEAVVTTLSSLQKTVQKIYVQTEDTKGTVMARSPLQKDIGIWGLTLSMDNKDKGQEYLEPGSEIIIEDTLPNTLRYISDDSNGKYDERTRKISWTFTVPSLEEQKVSEKLFDKSINLKTEFVIEQQTFTAISNTMTTEMTKTTGEIDQGKSTAKVNQAAGSNEQPTIPPKGIILRPGHYGPTNGFGGVGDENAYNPNPTVGPDATIKFRYSEVPSLADSPNKPFVRYESKYNIDSKLKIESVKLDSIVRYRPNTGYASDRLNQAAADQASVQDFYATVNGVEKIIVENAVKGTVYPTSSWKNYQNDGDRVTHIRSVSKERKAGINTYIDLVFTPKSGVSERATNRMCFNYAGYDAEGKLVEEKTTFDSQWMSNPQSIWGERYVTMVDKTTNNPIPIVYNTVSFLNQNNGVIELGTNRVKTTLNVDQTSKALIKAPYSSYIVLPEGITYDTVNPNNKLLTSGSIELVTHDYLSTGKDLVKINWERTSEMIPGESIEAEFNINVQSATATEYVPEVYSFIGSADFDTPTYSNSMVTNSVIVNDVNDLNGSGNKDEKIILSKNRYNIVQNDRIVAKESVKGSLNDTYANFGFTTLGGTINYQIELTNTGNQINRFTLLNILPSVGDVSITDNQPLDSKFDPVLTGPIQLPKETANEFEVYYSKSKNPSRTKLLEGVKWPDSAQPITDPKDAEEPNWIAEKDVKDKEWSEIHSFLIENKTNIPVVKGEKIVIDFKMNAPQSLSDSLLNPTIAADKRAAWNSFAYTANDLQPVEPAKVGVAVNVPAFNFKVIKEDEETKNKLSGAEFTLYDSDKTIVTSNVTAESGEVVFDNLTAGTYYLQETNSPNGYELNATMYEVEIDNMGNLQVKNKDSFISEIQSISGDEPLVSLTMVNQTKYKLPETGSRKLLLILIVSVVIIISYGVYINNKKVGTNNEE